MTSAAIFIT